MDPITIMSILALAGFIGAGADLATGGLVRAEFGGGARGAAGYLGSAGRKRWQESRRLARRERMKTPMGRAVQFILDEVGGLGRGLVRGWRSGARRGRRAWRERLGDGPIPAVRAWRGLGDHTRTWLEQRANGDAPNGPNDAGQDPIEARTDTPNGDPEREPEQSPNGPNDDPEREDQRAWWDPSGVTDDPFLGGPEQDPNGNPDDDPLPSRCPDCGMPIVIGNLSDHRLGRDRCPYANPNDTPNGGPHVDDLMYPDDLADQNVPLDGHGEPWGEPIPLDSSSPCPRPGCGGTLRPTTRPAHFDADGTAMIDTRCDRNCGMESYHSWTWDAPDWPDEDDEDVPFGPDPNDTPFGTPERPSQPTRTEGTTVPDINSAPAALALFEAFRGRFEEPESLLTALRDDIASAADAMGDFAIGGEGDLAAGPQAALDAVTHAKEALDGYLSALHLEYDASIEAAAAKQANAHRPMQEV